MKPIVVPTGLVGATVVVKMDEESDKEDVELAG